MQNPSNGHEIHEMHQGTAVRYTEKNFREEVIQNLLRQKEEKRLQLFGHVTTRIP
jgi:hypothetical protein